MDLEDQSEIDEYEVAMFVIRSEEPWPEGELDYAHYQALHRHLFQDVYAWAGEARTVRIGKGGNWFCYPEYINQEMVRIFAELASQNYLSGLALEVFSVKAAHVLAEINAVHPFREGNGRTQLSFLTILAENSGLPFNPDVLERNRVISAMIDSFSGNEAPLAQLIFDIVNANTS
ncbi:Fic/DOC family protein [Pararhizobium antarcticum]|uniref:Fic/DOC family protein n=1 Tax=Pararhizobium antarcticum TaxID=1798805 RepID=UPI001FD99A49|nr:Fic family protein [Pararhizobium antarcticum]